MKLLQDSIKVQQTLATTTKDRPVASESPEPEPKKPQLLDMKKQLDTTPAKNKQAYLLQGIRKSPERPEMNELERVESIETPHQ